MTWTPCISKRVLTKTLVICCTFGEFTTQSHLLPSHIAIHMHHCFEYPIIISKTGFHGCMVHVVRVLLLLGLSWAERSLDFCIHLGWLLYSGGAQGLFTLLFWSHTLPSITGVGGECWVWGGFLFGIWWTWSDFWMEQVVVIEQIDLRFQAVLGKTVCFKRSIFILSELYCMQHLLP